MIKFRVHLTETYQGTRLKRSAYYASLTFAIMVSTIISWSGFAAIGHNIRLQEAANERALAQKADDMRQTICLTNIVHHEARGEKSDVRKLLGKVVLAMASDPTFTKARNVCDLAKIPGMFSNIKFIEQVRAGTELWPTIYDEVSTVYESDHSLPPGWQCVRAFRLSDDKMETLSSKHIAQLGFTVNAKGLKYFAAKLVPVDTRGTITFYSDRGGCKNPTQTASR